MIPEVDREPLVEVRERVPRTPPLGPYLHRMVDFALQRKKSFWVDEALAFMLSETDIDLRASELRVPFPSFALVFTGHSGRFARSCANSNGDSGTCRSRTCLPLSEFTA